MVKGGMRFTFPPYELYGDSLSNDIGSIFSDEANSAGLNAITSNSLDLIVNNTLSNYGLSDVSSTLLSNNTPETVDGYFSEVWESWGEALGEFKTDVEKTNDYLLEQDFRSTVLQQIGNASDLVVDLFSSLIANDNT